MRLKHWTDRARAIAPTSLSGLQQVIWTNGLIAAAAWAAAALVTVALPDVVPWGSDGLFAIIMASGALALVVLAFAVPHLGRFGEGWIHYGPWLIAIGVWLTLWELTTAKFGWLPKPFFSPPNGLLNVYVTEASRLLICIGYTLRLWSIGFASGAVVGYALGVALGWSKRFSYWGMPILKLIGPVPATAWIPCTFFFFPTTFAASVFIVALSAGIPVAILTSSGVASVNRAYYDVGRNLGASEWYLVSKIAVPASLPHVFVGLFMALYYSFAVLVVAEMLGAKFGLGWYIQFETAYSGYANVYATLRHHGPHLRRHRQASVRGSRPSARLAEGVHLMAATATALRAPPAAARNVAIDIRGVSHAFDLDGSRLPVLESIDLSVAAGEFVALLGPSGCGKSTLLRLISGLEQPTSGSISAEGSLIDRPDPSRILVFQDPTLFPWATVWNNVATGLDARGVLKQRATSRRCRARSGRSSRLQQGLSASALGRHGSARRARPRARQRSRLAAAR